MTEADQSINLLQFESLLPQYHHYLVAKQQFSSDTIKVYLSVLKQFLRFCIKNHQELLIEKDCSFDKVDTRVFKVFLQDCSERGCLSQTLSGYTSCVKAFFVFLDQQQIAPHHSLIYLVPQVEIGEALFPDVDAKWIARLFATKYPKTFQGSRDRLILELFYGANLSIKKLADITKSSIDWQNHHATLTFMGQEQTFPLCDDALDTLAGYKKLREKFLSTKEYDPPNLLVNGRGCPMSRVSIARSLKHSMARIELDKHRTVILRHLSSKHFADYGADSRSLQTHRMSRTMSNIDVFKKEGFDQALEQFRKIHCREK